MRGALWLLAIAALLTGCAAPTLYSWGQYEELIYVTYSAPGKAAPEMQIEKLEQDYQKARADNKRVPPGFHAYLGYLYVQIGKVDEARRALETEKAEFPESTVFVDRLLTNLKKF